MPQLVLSASRRTDIPAFYMPWFMQAIKKGRFEVVNPYNHRTHLVPASPGRVHSIVFWSKNFGPFLRERYGQVLRSKGYHLFFNFTINSSHPVLEPALPSLEDRLEQLAMLMDRFGEKSVQWRFDPICFFASTAGRSENNLDDFDTIARRAGELGIQDCTTSFADLYRKVLRRIKTHSDLKLIDPDMSRKVDIITTLSRKLTALGIGLKLCCEKEVLDTLPKELPVTSAACIPGDRLIQLFGPGISLAKDHGQRRDAGCTCTVSKDIGSYDRHPCRHDCLFCYANPAMDRR